eukprot:TRINITY_DN2120_c0_g1_i1.p1 TRINITY_DN2120_c0_g1~~TRINITY_DN2120_c0_g1_i1.p1  ORF type:complete len:591 (-),score=58.73 TRINITY_DN2120_c0_g1_i1:77-1849(-)
MDIGRRRTRSLFTVSGDTQQKCGITRRRSRKNELFLVSLFVSICTLLVFCDFALATGQAPPILEPYHQEILEPILVSKKLTEEQAMEEKNYIYPRNITDVYKGEWRLLSNESIVTKMWSFEKTEGQIIYQLLTKSSPAYGIDIVKGDLVLRDGFYSTDNNQKYSIQGIYFWKTGDLILFGNPSNAPILQDFSMVLNKNTTFNDVLAATDANIELNNATSNLGCFFRLVFKVKSMSSANLMKLEVADPTSKISAQSHSDSPSVLIKIASVLQSPNCGVTLNAEAAVIVFDEYYAKAVNYVVMVTIVAFAQILLLIRQMEYTSTQASAAKVSLLTIGAQAVMDAYICLVHLTTGIVVETVFNAFATAAFFKFITFSVFEMRYLLLIWKARRPQSFSDGYISMRRELSLLYARFYASLMGGFLLLYFLSGLFHVFVFLYYSFWWPQIYCNATRDCKGGLHTHYIFGISITRLCIPLYFYACPENFIHAEPNYTISFLLILYMGVQVAILLLQDKFGPRFFVPRRFLPVKYNYCRVVPTRTEDRECVICMAEVEIREHDYMLTPCNHLFHSRCLSQWMEFKMECPTCRGALPPP